MLSDCMLTSQTNHTIHDASPLTKVYLLHLQIEMNDLRQGHELISLSLYLIPIEISKGCLCSKDWRNSFENTPLLGLDDRVNLGHYRIGHYHIDYVRNELGYY